LRRTERLQVDRQEFSEFYTKLEKLINEEFGITYDGSKNVEFILIDRSRCQPMHYFPVPYPDGEDNTFTIYTVAAALDRAMVNLRIASEDVFKLWALHAIEASKKKK
jgi:hypothetical protein